MGREVKRVPLDFNWPRNKVWKGFITPDELHEDPCPAGCEGGYSWQYTALKNLWYGHGGFSPAMTGSTPWTIDTPAIRRTAERHVEQAPEFYGWGERAVVREATRLRDLYNARWMHHLTQADVDVLLAEGRLRELTHQWVQGSGWQPREGADNPTAALVNEWSLIGFGHDSSNAWYVIKARCERYGTPTECPVCDGHGGLEVYPGQREDREKWEWTEPPEGEGYQLWETVSEGSPISPVFQSPEDLARWMTSPSYSWGIVKTAKDRPSYEGALGWIKGGGWAPSMIVSSKGVQDGVIAMAEAEDA